MEANGFSGSAFRLRADLSLPLFFDMLTQDLDDTVEWS